MYVIVTNWNKAVSGSGAVEFSNLVTAHLVAKPWFSLVADCRDKFIILFPLLYFTVYF